MNEIHELLSEQSERLRELPMTAANANAQCNTIGKTIALVKLQLDYGRMTGQPPEIPLLKTPVSGTLNAPVAGKKSAKK